MTSWERLRELCLEALEQPEGERAAYLDRACADDAALRAEVESLIAQHDPEYLEEPWVDVRRLDEVDSPPELPSHVGAYRIERLLGRGGMGEVYLGVQVGDGFERPVAIKVVRSGMATADVLDRFRLERRILASLDHPNLATLIDGGATESGLPYFVMEYVDGRPITDYCDAEGLPVPARLRLFLAVCNAVHHAHQSLVVHRDIKPSNILVTADGLPKLLDFGIGKVLDPPGEQRPGSHTALTRRVLTPEYAAPEQVTGAPITTATDVHGLGVLLYELLTGVHPFTTDAGSDEQLRRALLEETPTPPSTVAARAPDAATRRGTAPQRLRRRLRGDLDNIVLKALRKEPERRYASVEALRADVDRHLRGLPVAARPDSLAYRASKFATRNPWGVVAAALAAIALGVSIVLPWRQNVRLTAERDKALEVQGFLLEAFGTTAGDETIGARELLDLQAARVDSLYVDQPELRAQMLLVLADAYDRLGRYDDALRHARAALEGLRALHGGDHAELASGLNAVGWAMHRVGDGEGGAPVLAEAVEMRRRLGRDARRELARSLNDLGVVVSGLGHADSAVALHGEALSIRRTVLGDADRATGVSASNLAAAMYGAGDLEGAIREARLALDLLRRSVGEDHQRTIIVQNNLAVFMFAARDFEGAAAQYRDLLARQTSLQGPDHPITNQLRDGLARALVQLGRYDEALVLADHVVAHARAAGDSEVDRELSGVRNKADALAGLGRLRDAVDALEEGIARAEELRPGRPIVQSLLADRAALLARIE